MGLSFTKRESKLQNESFIYKTGVLDYKWDSRVAIHLYDESIALFLMFVNIFLMFVIKLYLRIHAPLLKGF